MARPTKTLIAAPGHHCFTDGLRHAGTIRRHLEQANFSQMDAVVLAVDNADLSIYEVLLPLYFPRSSAEEAQSRWLLPADIGGPMGEPVVADRQIRIIDNPHHSLTGAYKQSRHAVRRAGRQPNQH